MPFRNPFTTPETRTLLRLASPIILSQVAQVLMGLLDSVMSGHAGAHEQAIVALGIALWIPVFVSLMSVVQAVSPVIARHYGAGDHAAVVRDAQQGVWLALMVGSLPLLLIPYADELLIASGIAVDLADRTSVLLWGIGLGMPAAMVFRALAFYSASIGQTRPMMVLAFIGLAVNGVLNWGLIYGHLGLPAMGGAGCGWATGIGMWVSVILMVGWTRRATVYKPYDLWKRWGRPSWADQRHLLRIGLPMGGAAFVEVASFAGIAILVGRFGEVQIAAHQVALNFSSLTFMLPMGLSSALTIRVGHLLGAGDPVAARHAAWNGIRIGLLIAIATTVPYFLLRNEIAAVYSSDVAVQRTAATLLLFAAFWQLFDATQVCAIGALRAYKVTLLPMVLMFVAFWVIGIPSGSWLGYRGFGDHGPFEVYGFWMGLLIGLVLVSLALVYGLRRVADRHVHP